MAVEVDLIANTMNLPVMICNYQSRASAILNGRQLQFLYFLVSVYKIVHVKRQQILIATINIVLIQVCTQE